jgi:hypothetical protein
MGIDMKDEIYEVERNKLIPEAINHADFVAGPHPKNWEKSEDVRNEWNRVWNLAFHSTMNNLAKKRGVVK